MKLKGKITADLFMTVTSGLNEFNDCEEMFNKVSDYFFMWSKDTGSSKLA
jgi:hypothetical protein